MPRTSKSRASRGRATAPIEPTPSAELLDVYIDELAAEPVANAEAQKDLARRMRNPSVPAAERERSREALIRVNLRFAFSIAKQYQNRGLALEDLVGEANAGLCRAVDKYDPDVGVNFISYAVWWIRQSIFAAISTQSRTVRIPLGRAADVRRIARARAALRDRLQREPTLEEVARVAELPSTVVEELTAASQPERSLDEPLSDRGGQDGARTLATVLEVESDDDGDGVIGRLEDESMRDALLHTLEPLPPRDRRILLLYYGLESGEPMTMEEIARIFGVTRERVRQIRDRALAAVRDGVRAKDLRRDWAA
jgi:RNA polymerase primary sigma factor